MDNIQNAQPRAPKSSSPRFPAMSLQTAMEKAKAIWDAEGKHPARSAALAAHWNLSEKSSALRSYLAALAHYGLLEQIGGPGTGEYKLTERALKILAGEPGERAASLREAALQPKIYRQLWDRFNGDLPSDPNLESRLLLDFGLNKDSTRGFIKDLRSTIAFAKLEKPENTTGDHEEQPPEPPSDPIAPLPRPPIQSGGGTINKPPMTANIRYLPIPLDIGEAGIPVGMSDSDFDLLLDTLKLWKKKIVRPASQSSNVAKDMIFPCKAIWKNKDHDVPVEITNIAGERDGVRYYQASTGTGIPASELTFEDT
jgi:hypothetical protein